MGKISVTFLDDIRWLSPTADSYILKDGEVHVYQIPISDHLRLLDRFSATLTSAEKERGQKYHQLKDRQRFVVSRGAQRYILAKYLNTNPAELEFKLGDNKKPYLFTGEGAKLNYNVSHAGDKVVLAVSRSIIGVDVELVDPNFQFRDILNEYFSKEEIAYINAADPFERFFRLWTRKEAFLKATGEGLGEHLKTTPAMDGQHTLATNLLGNDNNWMVTTVKLDDHLISIATEQQAQGLSFYNATF